MDDKEKLKILADTLRQIGDVAIPPDVSPMQAVIDIQAMADEALEKTWLAVRRRPPGLHLVRD
jgi:hypothetical protein